MTPPSPPPTDHLLDGIAGLWERGWQPDDLVHVAGRDLGRAGRLLVAALIVAEAFRARPAESAVHPEWAAQLANVATELVRSDACAPARSRGPDGAEWLRTATGLGASAAEPLGRLPIWMSQLPTLPILIPPPSGWVDDAATRLRWATEHGLADDLEHKVLTRVRALLAKAESTPYEAEAEALTAKAQELVARHAIDHALLTAGHSTADAEAAIGRRVIIEDPYASPKSTLLASIADANRCRAVYSPDLGFSTVFGFPGDLRAVELLYTSLLVQSTTAMIAAGAHQPAGSSRRSRGFRSSFLSAYAVRIGQRLVEATAATEREARTGVTADALPVLAARREAVDAALDEAFPRVTSRRIRPSDATGWHAGVAAADRARLGEGPTLGTTPRGALGR